MQDNPKLKRLFDTESDGEARCITGQTVAPWWYIPSRYNSNSNPIKVDFKINEEEKIDFQCVDVNVIQ